MIAGRALLVVLGISAEVLSAQSTPAREHQKKGIEYARNGQWESAEAELRQSVALAPNDPQVLATLGGVLGMEHKVAEAASYFQKALTLAPDNTIIRRDLARSQWQLGQIPEARRNLEQVLKSTPADKQAVLLLGMVMENLGDYPAAAKLLESVSSLVRADPLAAGALARSYYRMGKTEQARAYLQSVFAQAGQPEAIFTAALVAADAMDFAWAEKMFSSIRSTYPDALNLGYNLALVQYHQEHFADSQRTLSELIISGKDNGDIRNLLGWCCQRQGKTKEAVAELEAAIHLEPSREVHYLDLARVFLANANPGAALNVTRRAAQLFPRSDQVWLLQGSIETGLQSFTDAVKSYTSAVALNKNDAEPRRALATAQWLAGMTVEGQGTFQDLLRRFPRDAANYAAYGALLVGDSASSEVDVMHGVKLLETALVLDASLAEPHYYLGNLALTKGDIESATRHLEAAVKLNPANSKAHFALSKALRRQGRAEESAQEMRVYEETKAAEERSWKPPSN